MTTTASLPLPLLLLATAADVHPRAIARSLDVPVAEVYRHLQEAPDARDGAVAAASRLRDAIARWPSLMVRREGACGQTVAGTQPGLSADAERWYGCARGAPEQFRRWFGRSQMVDGTGAPLVVYHATSAEEDFSTFERSEDIGFHFGSLTSATHRLLSLVRAERWASENAECVDIAEPMIGPRIVPVYLRIERPVRLPDLHTWSPSAVLGAFEPYLTPGMIEEAESWDVIGIAEGRELLAMAGCDGIVYSNYTERGGDSWLVADPCQIKSALANDGGFRSDDPHMHR